MDHHLNIHRVGHIQVIINGRRRGALVFVLSQCVRASVRALGIAVETADL